jgi:8-amino-7-oxononanoate synthase
MLDFTSALYLGIEHASWELEPWSALTQGRPAALAEPLSARELAANLAVLMNCESGVLMPSTLHLFWDLFTALAREPIAVLLDDAAYPMARWGVERVACSGIPVCSFSHLDTGTLPALLRAVVAEGRKPVIATDGVCLTCGRAAPLRRYLKLIEHYDGLLVIDDTQALGILGIGGGGSLRRWGLRSPRALIGASLAKALGVPVAVLAGGAGRIREFVGWSDTRVHSSPPCAAVVAAGRHALAMNASRGDELRRRLSALVVRFQRWLGNAGLDVLKHPFPVQALQLPAHVSAVDFHRALLSRSIQTVAHRNPHTGAARVSFIITAAHRPADIDRAGEAIIELMDKLTPGTGVRARPASQPTRGI